jgi:protein TonB
MPPRRTTAATSRPPPTNRRRTVAKEEHESRPKRTSSSAAKSSSRAHARRGGRAPGKAHAAGDGAARAAAEGLYLAELQRAIAKHRFYPRAARRRSREGEVTVSFVIQADGRITGIRVTKSSGSDALDRAAVRTLENLGRFRPIPAKIGRTRWALRVPINFALR